MIDPAAAGLVLGCLLAKPFGVAIWCFSRSDVPQACGNRFVQQKSSRESLQGKILPNADYGEGEVLTLMFVSVFDSVLFDGAGDSFTIVVLVSFFSLGGLVTVVSFCSQAASNTAPARMQIYFFIT